MWQDRGRKRQHSVFICKTGYTETVFSGSCHYVFCFQIMPQSTRNNIYISFRIYSGVARYIAKQHGKDRKNDHQIALPHHWKAPGQQEQECSSREKQAECRRGDGLCHGSGPHPQGCSRWHGFTGSCCSLARPDAPALHPGLPRLQPGQRCSCQMPKCSAWKQQPRTPPAP